MFCLPWMPKDLNPNRKVHWTKKAKLFKQYKLTCYACAKKIEQINPILLTFHPPTRVRRDKDNCIAAFKAGQDGIALAWGIDDSELKVFHQMGEPIKGGKVKIEIFSIDKIDIEGL